MNEAEIPIDIHTGKLQDWLISRRIVNKNWHQYVRDIRNKINNAITNMPAHDGLVKLLYGAHINYFHCPQIIEILKTTEADSKNLFGQYGSQRMKDWQEIIKLYEKDNIYIAEAAQILVRNINFEIPGVKKQISKFEQLSEEAEKKIHDLQKSENVLRGEYTVLCNQLGIKGDNVRQELVEKLNELPDMLSKISSSVSSFNKAIRLYSGFLGNDESLPTIRYIVASGNTTVYEFLYSEPPLSVEEPPVKFEVVEQTENNAEEIDFGDNAIDFRDENVELDVGDIDWGESNDADEGNESNESQIDFSISLEESGIVVEGVGNSGGVAKGDEAYTMLDSPFYRELFINELLELEAFLKMRLYELSTSNNIQILSLSIMDNFPDHDAETISEMLTNVEVVYSNTTSQLLHHLHQIKHSAKYVDILTSKLKQKLIAIEKMKHTEMVLKEKSKVLHEQSVEMQPTLVRIIHQTKILQEKIEKDISKRYKNRVVNLMGGVNAI